MIVERALYNLMFHVYGFFETQFKSVLVNQVWTRSDWCLYVRRVVMELKIPKPVFEGKFSGSIIALQPSFIDVSNLDELTMQNPSY